MRYFIFIIFTFLYISNAYALKNKHQFILELPNGTVINEGGILTQEGYILQDTQTSLGDQHRLLKKNEILILKILYILMEN